MKTVKGRTGRLSSARLQEGEGNPAEGLQEGAAEEEAEGEDVSQGCDDEAVEDAVVVVAHEAPILPPMRALQPLPRRRVRRPDAPHLERRRAPLKPCLEPPWGPQTRSALTFTHTTQKDAGQSAGFGAPAGRKQGISTTLQR